MNREEKIARGICMNCERPARTGHRRCGPCAEKQVEWSRRWHEKKRAQSAPADISAPNVGRSELSIGRKNGWDKRMYRPDNATDWRGDLLRAAESGDEVAQWRVSQLFERVKPSLRNRA